MLSAHETVLNRSHEIFIKLEKSIRMDNLCSANAVTISHLMYDRDSLSDFSREM